MNSFPKSLPVMKLIRHLTLQSKNQLIEGKQKFTQKAKTLSDDLSEQVHCNLGQESGKTLKKLLRKFRENRGGI